MKRDSWLVIGLGLVAAVIGGFLFFWLLVRLWVAFGFLAVVALLLGFAWWYDRREKRARAGVSQ
jgi:membrane protein implicated in regulation of membrane protease activity